MCLGFQFYEDLMKQIYHPATNYQSGGRCLIRYTWIHLENNLKQVFMITSLSYLFCEDPMNGSKGIVRKPSTNQVAKQICVHWSGKQRQVSFHDNQSGFSISWRSDEQWQSFIWKPLMNQVAGAYLDMHRLIQNTIPGEFSWFVEVHCKFSRSDEQFWRNQNVMNR